MRPTRRAVLLNTIDRNVRFEDNFGGGNLDTSKWTVTDTESKITVSGGNLSFSGGKAVAAWADPALVSVKSWNRVAGLCIEWEVTPGATNTFLNNGFSQSNLTSIHSIYLASGGLLYVNRQASILTPLAYTAVSTWLRIVLLSTGALYYVSTDERVTWKLIWKDASITTTPLYAFIESYDAAPTSAGVKVFYLSPKPAILQVTPGAPALVAGSEQIVNGDFAAWTTDDPDSWTLKAAEDGSNYITQNPAGQCQLIKAAGTVGIYQGAHVAGTWYVVSLDVNAVVSGDWAIGIRNTVTLLSGSSTGTKTRAYRATNTFELEVYAATNPSNLTVDNFSRKPLPFDQTGVLEYIADAGQHDGIYDSSPSVSAGYHAGIVCHANSATAPTYCLYAYVDVTAAKAYLLKIENNTTTELIGAAITYSAGAQLRVVSVGSKHALYYNGAIVGTVQTVDVSSNYGTHVHSFQTAAGDSVGACAVNGGT